MLILKHSHVPYLVPEIIFEGKIIMTIYIIHAQNVQFRYFFLIDYN